MTPGLRLNLTSLLLGTTFVLSLSGTTAPAQINTDIIEKHRADLEKQATDPATKRERGTHPEDWLFNLGDGVTTRQITFYSDDAPCYGRIFFPKGFTTRGKWPAVVLPLLL
jgi:hypothetical protein